MKLPPFWPTDPEIWFAQVEAQFTTRNIRSQRTKFDHFVASLSPKFAVEVRDLILHPPAEQPYDKIKEQLIRRTAASKQRRLQQLFTAEELGDRKPTQLLRRMQQLLGDHADTADNSFLRELFLQRLPANVRMVPASTPDTSGSNLDKLAEMADKIMEVATPAVSSVATPIGISTEVEQLCVELSCLGKLVSSLAHCSRSSSRPSSDSRSSRCSPTPTPRSNSSDLSTPSLCWYQAKYGEQARKCKQPCFQALRPLADGDGCSWP